VVLEGYRKFNSANLLIYSIPNKQRKIISQFRFFVKDDLDAARLQIKMRVLEVEYFILLKNNK
jgi:hypothetical protein